MSDEIERLRTELLEKEKGLGLLRRAKERRDDEIEQLKEELAKWRKVADLYYESHENRRNCSLIASCKKCDAYEKAVRGE